MPDHSDAFVPFDLSLKIPLWSKLGSCIHSHFHFLIAVESANSNCDCDSHQSVPPIMPHPNASILYKCRQCNHHHYKSTTSFELCSIFCRTALLVSHNLILLSTGCDLNGETCVAHPTESCYDLRSKAKFPMSLPLRINLFPE